MITTTGVKLRIRVLQPVSKPTSHRIDKALFFVHGVGGSSDIWMSQLKFFSEKGYHVIAPDLVGHGFSDSPKKPKHYEFDSISHHVIDVFDGFYKEFNIVIGHSYGWACCQSLLHSSFTSYPCDGQLLLFRTSFAAYLARKRAARVDKLVLMSGGAPVSLAPQPGIFSLPSAFLTCLRPALSKLFYRRVSRLLTSWKT